MSVNIVNTDPIIYLKLLDPRVLRLKYVPLDMLRDSFHQLNTLNLSRHTFSGYGVSPCVKVTLTVAVHFRYRQETVHASLRVGTFFSPCVN